MSTYSDLWMDEVERIVDDFCMGKISRDEALDALRRKGFDRSECEDILTEATS